MLKRVFTLAFLCAGFWSSVNGSASAAATNHDDHPGSAPQSVNTVIEWNRTLLAIVRTPGAQPPTIHSTRSFAMLHAAIFDAVNNIDRDFNPYAVRHPHVSRRASAQAAADQAAHDVLISLYPAFTTKRQQQTRLPTMFSSRFTPLSQRRSILNFSRIWHRFRMDATSPTASRRVRTSPLQSWHCEATMDRPPSFLPSCRKTSLEAIN